MRRQSCLAKHGAVLLREETMYWAWWCQRAWAEEYFCAANWWLVVWAMLADEDGQRLAVLRGLDGRLARLGDGVVETDDVVLLDLHGDSVEGR